MSNLQQAAVLVMEDEELANLVRNNSGVFADAIFSTLPDEAARTAILNSLAGDFGLVLEGMYDNHTKRSIGAITEATGAAEAEILEFVASSSDYRVSSMGLKTYIEKVTPDTPACSAPTCDTPLAEDEPMESVDDEFAVADDTTFFGALAGMFERFSKRSVKAVARVTGLTEESVIDLISGSTGYDITYGRSKTYVVEVN